MIGGNLRALGHPGERAAKILQWNGFKLFRQIFVTEIGQSESREPTGGEPCRLAERQAAIRTTQHQYSRVRPSRSRFKERTMKRAPDINAMDIFTECQLLQPRTARRLALTQQPKLNGLGRKRVRRNIGLRLLV